MKNSLQLRKKYAPSLTKKGLLQAFAVVKEQWSGFYGSRDDRIPEGITDNNAYLKLHDFLMHAEGGYGKKSQKYLLVDELFQGAALKDNLIFVDERAFAFVKKVIDSIRGRAFKQQVALKGLTFNHDEKAGNSALHNAVLDINRDKINILIKFHPEYQQQQNTEKQTPLYMAIQQYLKDNDATSLDTFLRNPYYKPRYEEAKAAVLLLDRNDFSATVRLMMLLIKQPLLVWLGLRIWPVDSSITGGIVVSVANVLMKKDARPADYAEEYNLVMELLTDGLEMDEKRLTQEEVCSAKADLHHHVRELILKNYSHHASNFFWSYVPNQKGNADRDYFLKYAIKLGYEDWLKTFLAAYRANVSYEGLIKQLYMTKLLVYAHKHNKAMISCLIADPVVRVDISDYLREVRKS